MSIHLISILLLVVAFVIATTLPINLGAIALVAAFIVGSIALEGSPGDVADGVVAGFPGGLFVTLVGVTFLFAIARANGTVDWLVDRSVRAVRGRIVLIPWIMFAITAVLTAFGSVVPAAVAIIAPIGLSLAVQHRINPMIMGLSIINGATAGGFSPLSIFGSITNGVVDGAGLPGNPLVLFLGSLVFNTLLNVAAFFLFGGRRLIGRVAEEPAAVGGPEVAPGGGPGAAKGATTGATGAGFTEGERRQVTTLDRNRSFTLVALVGVAVGALGFQLDVGLLAITAAVVLSILAPTAYKGAVAQVAWPTVLLVCGVATYVALMEENGTIDVLGEGVAGLAIPLLAALLLFYIGSVVSAFASTTGIITVLIPLAVPLLMGGQLGVVGVITAFAISSSVVDSSPYSTSGALTVANAPEEHRDYVYKRLLVWGFSMVLLTPPITWLLLVAPGWL
ncbi:SLC13 family permease [Pseudonocardia kunmingensis]|uniref:UIT1 family transporter n=1 Tax=Pseudonocardia kunmingensis TaxID=630975 RepID=A0A543D9Y6_9PSEU|nr:SLC13 family permease [Pseudonocardia kunmingensis]TQM06151.1 UIT1 family transporter [Pseudonocardia kunmingensis]